MPAKDFMEMLRDHAMSFFRTGDQACTEDDQIVGKKSYFDEICDVPRENDDSNFKR